MPRLSIHMAGRVYSHYEKENDTRMKLNIELYVKVDFLGTGVGL